MMTFESYLLMQERLRLDNFIPTQIREKPAAALITRPAPTMTKQCRISNERLSIHQHIDRTSREDHHVYSRFPEFDDTPFTRPMSDTISYAQLPTPPLTPPFKSSVNTRTISSNALGPASVRKMKLLSSSATEVSRETEKPRAQTGETNMNRYGMPIPDQVFNSDKTMPYVGKYVRKKHHPLGGWLHPDDKPMIIDSTNPFASYLKPGENLVFIGGALNANKEVFEEPAYYVTCPDDIEQPFMDWDWDDRPIEHDRADINACLEELKMTPEGVNPDLNHCDPEYMYKIKYLDGRNKVVDLLEKCYLQEQGYSSFDEVYEDWMAHAADRRPKDRGHSMKWIPKTGCRPYLSLTKEERVLNPGCIDWSPNNENTESHSSQFIEKLRSIDALKAYPPGHNPVPAWLEKLEDDQDLFEGHLHQNDAQGRKAVKVLRNYQDGCRQRFEFEDVQFCSEIEDWMRPRFIEKYSRVSNKRPKMVEESRLAQKLELIQSSQERVLDDQAVATEISTTGDRLQTSANRPECSELTVLSIIQRLHQLHIDIEGLHAVLLSNPEEAGCPSFCDGQWEGGELDDVLYALDGHSPRSDGTRWTVAHMLENGFTLNSLQKNQWGHNPLFTDLKLGYMDSCEEPNDFICRYREALCMGIDFGNPDADVRLEKVVRAALFYARRVRREPQFFLNEQEEEYDTPQQIPIDEGVSLFPDVYLSQQPTIADWVLRVGGWCIDVTDEDHLPLDQFLDCTCGRIAANELQEYQDSQESGENTILVPEWARPCFSSDDEHLTHKHLPLLPGPLYCQFHACDQHTIMTDRVSILFQNADDPGKRLEEILELRQRDYEALNAVPGSKAPVQRDRSPMQSLLASCPPPKTEKRSTLHELLVEHRNNDDRLGSSNDENRISGVGLAYNLAERQAAELKALLGIKPCMNSTQEMQQATSRPTLSKGGNLCDSGYGSWPHSEEGYHWDPQCCTWRAQSPFTF